jgi:ABC-type uncharacterized transport system permease subunit
MQVSDLLLGFPIAYVALQWLALRRLRHGWRTAALIPGIFLMGALALFVVGIVTNASVAAIWLVIGLPLATLYLALLVPLHWIAGFRG